MKKIFAFLFLIFLGIALYTGVDSAQRKESLNGNQVIYRDPYRIANMTSSNIMVPYTDITDTILGNTDNPSGKTYGGRLDQTYSLGGFSMRDAVYSWNTGGWSSCSKSCGGGTQTRTVTCNREDGNIVPDSYCSGTKPASSQACNTQCCGDDLAYHSPVHQYGCVRRYTERSYQTAGARESGAWDFSLVPCTAFTPVYSCGYQDSIYERVAGSRSSCSNSCGTGTQTRTIACRRNGSTYVSDAFCDERSIAKPATSRSCDTSGSGCVNGSCGSGTNTCTAGSFRDRSDTSTYLMWYCDGSSGGSTAYCSKRRGECGSSNNQCIYGGLYDAPDSSSYYLWVCGWGDGTNVNCNLPK